MTMRSYLVVLILAAFAAGVWAQDPAKKPDETPPAGEKKAEEAKKPAAWKLDAKSAKRVRSSFK